MDDLRKPHHVFARAITNILYRQKAAERPHPILSAEVLLVDHGERDTRINTIAAQEPTLAVCSPLLLRCFRSWEKMSLPAMIFWPMYQSTGSGRRKFRGAWYSRCPAANIILAAESSCHDFFYPFSPVFRYSDEPRRWCSGRNAASFQAWCGGPLGGGRRYADALPLSLERGPSDASMI